MEVEFLSNMRYDLYASAEEWAEWKANLGRFGAFYETALHLPAADQSRSTAPVTPTAMNFPQKLPSPPSTHHHASPYSASTSLASHYPTLPYPNSPLRQQRIPSISQQERKRSLDQCADVPVAKRPHYSTALSSGSGAVHHALPYPPSSLRVSPNATINSTTLPAPSMTSDMPRLELPNIEPGTLMPSGQLAPLSIPISRAMSSVYPGVNNTYPESVTPISAVPPSLYQTPIPNLGDGSRNGISHSAAHASPSHGFTNGTPTHQCVLIHSSRWSCNKTIFAFQVL